MATTPPNTTPFATSPEDVTGTVNPTAAGLINSPAPTAATAASTTATLQDPAVKWDVNSDQTVQGQVKNIIAENSPLMQQAETRSLQKANARGLMNSSIAVGAGQAALYDAALPMAQQDAAMYGKAAETNTGAQNQVNSQNSQLQTNVDLNNTAAKNTASQFNASESNQILKLGMDAASKKELAGIEASYKMLMQSSAGAADLYKQMVTNASAIMTNKDMASDTKAIAIRNQIALLNNGLGLLGQIGNLDLSNLLDFNVPGAAVS